MRTIIISFFIGLSYNCMVNAQEVLNTTKTDELIIGEWTIDLRPTPNSEGYFQTFEVLEIEQNTFTGSFYGSDIKNGLINTNWSRLYFAFTTSDSSNDYYHSGYLEKGKLYGQSYCPNRAFTAPWTGSLKQ
ncbi:MAG: hypothetical protein KJO22_06105 [Bacteroidia bacterium]|nr:hypothetical protein [Bacteroidia bacterium]